MTTSSEPSRSRVVEQSSANQRNAQCAEVRLAHDHHRPDRRRIADGVALSFRGEVVGDRHLIRRQADRGGGALHAGHGLQSLQQPLIERPRGILVLVAGVWKRELECQQVAGFEADVDVLQPDEAADQEAGADRQHQRQRDLGDHERALQRSAGPAGTRSLIVAQRLDQVRPRDLERRRGAEEQACDQRHGQREQHHARVHADLGDARDDQLAQRQQRAGQHDPEDDPERAAGQAEQGGLGEQLPRNPRAACAERCPNRDLTLPRRRAGQQQVGDVRERDQQQDPDRAEQQVERRAGVADDRLGQRHRLEAPVARSVLLLERRGDRVQVRPRRVATSFPAAAARGRPDRTGRGATADRWCGCARDRAPAAETAGPAGRRPTIVQLTSSSRIVWPMIAGFAPNRRVQKACPSTTTSAAPGRIVCRREEAPELRLDAEGREEVAGHPRRRARLRAFPSRSG